MIFVGVGWAEAHNDVVVMDEGGRILARGRFGVGVAGLAGLHGLVADHADEPEQISVGIEIDHGLVVDSLVGAGYQIYGLNPLSVARYRERHVSSGAKSDAGDAKILADLVRTDRHNHRQIAGDSAEVGAIRVLARGHQGLVWTRQRQLSGLRSALRDYFPAALSAFARGPGLGRCPGGPDHRPDTGSGAPTLARQDRRRPAGRRAHAQPGAAGGRDPGGSAGRAP